MNVPTEESFGPVLDLDEVISEPVQFKLKGRMRTMKPLDVGSFLAVVNKMALLKSIAETKTTPQAMAEAYYSLFKTCIDPITLEEVMDMHVVQIAMTLSLILRRQYGEDLNKAAGGEGQKKKPSTLKSRPPRSWLKRLFSLGGPQSKS